VKTRLHALTVTLLIWTSLSPAAAPVRLELLEAKRIWDAGSHNAFTDLVRWKGTFYCAFREGRGHVSTDGKIRVIQSNDADNWESAQLIELAGYDLRDAHLSVTPDGRLMLLGGAAPRKNDNQSAPTGTFACFSQDGSNWTKPQIVVEPGRWLWCVTWHEGKAYGVSYAAGEGKPYLDLLVSSDGVNYTKHVEKLFGQGYPTEVTLRFDQDGTCYALVRRDRSANTASSAMLGISAGDYTQWKWHDLGAEFNGFGGPNFIRLPGGRWIGAGRMHQGGAHTALTHVDVGNGTMTALLKLPSGGDTSYPGLLWHDNVLYVSYYSSHEGKTSIYLAKVKVTPSGNDFGAEANPTGNPIGGGRGYTAILKVRSPVTSEQQLRAALADAKAGDIVFLDGQAEIDLTGKPALTIPAGVTLAGDRGNQGAQGALLYSTDLATSPMILVGGDGVRITGLRLRGPDQQRRTEQMSKLYKAGRYYSIPNSDAIICSHANLNVDNCELYGWSHAAVFLKAGATGAHIHHNYMHHNQRSGLGYGVCLDQADALIEANLFDFCRHHIAGTGRPGTSYEARHNLVLENANGHSFDMHGGRDRKDGTDIAGDWIKIHHNTFRATSVPAVVIRGRPTETAEIHHNRFLHADAKAAVRQTNATGNLTVHQNQYTADRLEK
jgi:hypothetical protein